MNRVILWGRCGAAPELLQTKSGGTVLKIRLATTERVKQSDGTWGNASEWHSVVSFSKANESLARIIGKGSGLSIIGRLRTTSFEAKDGSGKRYKTEVIADEIELTDRKGDSGQSRGGGGGYGGSTTQGGGYDDMDYGSGDSDDIPF